MQKENVIWNSLQDSKQQEEAELEDLLKAEEGTTIILEGAVHSVRDMGEIAFVILRKKEGLIQTVWEEGKTDLELSEIREGDYIHVTGQVKDEERAPHGKEVRLSTISHLSHVSCPLPLPIDKWKLNTSLEAKIRPSFSLFKKYPGTRKIPYSGRNRSRLP